MTTDDTPTTEVVAQPALPTLELPDFEGIRPVGVVTKVNGAGSRIARPLHLEERVVLVVEVEVSNVGHAATDAGVKRIQTTTVKDLYELEGKAGKTLLRSLRQAYAIADDQRHGRRPILADLEQPDGNAAGVDVVVDEQGRVHTASLGLPHVDVAVLVFGDGTRALWPDDFPAASGPHPEAGERIHRPGAKKDAEPELVRQVLDADTGETLEEWTDEQEDARLRELEHELAVEEARQDREAADELLAARERKVLVDRIFAAEDGAARAAGSVVASIRALDDPKALDLALQHETMNQGRKTVIAAIEETLDALTKTEAPE